MALRFQFLNDVAGPIIIDKPDPIGINNLRTQIKRSEDNEGIIYLIVIDLEFIEEGRQYLMYCFNNAGGIDANVVANIYDFDPNARKWELYVTGKVNYSNREVTEDRIIVTIEQTGFERRILNMLERDIDLETLQSENGTALPATPTVDMVYHSKSIFKELKAVPQDGNEFQKLAVFSVSIDNTGLPGQFQDVNILSVGSLDIGKELSSDLQVSFQTPFDWFTFPFTNRQTNDLPFGSLTEAQYITFLSTHLAGREPRIIASETGVQDIIITMNFKPSIYSGNTGGDVDVCGEGSLGNTEVYTWMECRDNLDNVKYIEQIGFWSSMVGCGGDQRIGSFETKNYQKLNQTIEIGDKFYVYDTYRVWGSYGRPVIPDGNGIVTHEFRIQFDETITEISFRSKTTFRETTSKTILLHEAVQKCCQHITNQVDCFRSSLLGRPEITIPGVPGNPYSSDGQGALNGITNGNNLRERPRQIFSKLQDLLDFINSLYCTSFGFEILDGKQILRLEKKSYFFNKNSLILSLGKVYNVKLKGISTRYYNKIELGYLGKLDIEQANGVDEFNTVRRFNIPVVNTKGELKVGTKMRASGYQIENQRRLSVSSKDNKLDDDNFVVNVIRDGLTFKPKKTEGYTAFTNISDPDSSYNLDISPARNLPNWFQVIASSLIRSTNKVLTFATGEVNFQMTSRKTTEASPVAENGNVSVAFVEPLWDNDLITFRHPLSRDELKLIKANPYGYIELEDRFGEKMQGFIQMIEHEPNDGMADFELLKVFRP